MISKPWHHPDRIAREVEAFASLLREEKIKSYLEIGSKFGGSLWGILTQLPPPIEAVSVDIRHPRHGTALEDCASELNNQGHDVTLLFGNSRNSKVIESVRNLGPYDVVYIDGDHSQEGVTSDWLNYGSMGRMVAFHDINDKNGMWVPYLWTELKKTYPYKEFVFDSNNYGIGVLWL